MAEEITVDLGRDFWICETGTGQQVAQLHERYMIMMMIMMFRVLPQRFPVSPRP